MTQRRERGVSRVAGRAGAAAVAAAAGRGRGRGRGRGGGGGRGEPGVETPTAGSRIDGAPRDGIIERIDHGSFLTRSHGHFLGGGAPGACRACRGGVGGRVEKRSAKPGPRANFGIYGPRDLATKPAKSSFFLFFVLQLLRELGEVAKNLPMAKKHFSFLSDWCSYDAVFFSFCIGRISVRLRHSVFFICVRIKYFSLHPKSSDS